jgi:hypothetical protein
MFKTMKTSDVEVHRHKTLLYAHHGYGKTYQFRHYREMYGPGLIISGESGLSSISDCDIDFLPFSSWDGEHDPAKGVYSFVGIVSMLRGIDLRAEGINWIGIDSLTEMSERCLGHYQKVSDDAARATGKKPDGFAVWGDYERAMIGYLKWVRDLPVHVLVTALAMEEEDDNGSLHYWPLLKMKKVAKHVPALFDHVFCGIRRTVETPLPDGTTATRVARYLITDEVKGWHGKTRDPRQRLRPVEHTGNIAALHKRMAMSEEDFAALMRGKSEPATEAATSNTEVPE